jgi:hypothetical protein
MERGPFSVWGRMPWRRRSRREDKRQARVPNNFGHPLRLPGVLSMPLIERRLSKPIFGDTHTRNNPLQANRVAISIE